MNYELWAPFIILCAIIYLILMILLPIFVYAISARARSIDRKLDEVIELLSRASKELRLLRTRRT